MNAYQQSAALRAAIEFDLFTAIGEGTNTAASLARRCAASERGMRILCGFLAVHGFLRGSVAPDNPMWVDFARGMAPMMALPAELIAGVLNSDSKPKWKVLDIAAGHGLFGIVLARHNPNAEIVALDWPRVLEVAKENAQAAGVSARFRTLPGNAFDVDYGTGYDLVLLTNFLHHFDPPTCEKLLRKIHTALAPKGRVVTLEFVPNEDRIFPPVPATFSLIMLATTPSGDAYTFPEFQQMFRNAGFAKSELHELPPTEQRLIVSHK